MSNLMTKPNVKETTLADPEARRTLETIMGGQRAGVLGTSFMDIPLCSQMAFAITPDLRTLIVVTPRQTTKFDNMAANPNVSFLVSTARNEPTDPASAQAVTVTAFATELEAERRHEAVTSFSRRHPNLSAFAAAPDSAVMELKVDSYQLVSNFQQLTHVGLG